MNQDEAVPWARVAAADRLEFDRRPPDDVRLAVCEWLRFHGIDPSVVPCPGWVERRAADRQVVLEVYVLDEHGALKLNAERDDGLREIRVVQLEARPAPFPAAAVEYLDLSEAQR